jgi:hypothetical protein
MIQIRLDKKRDVIRPNESISRFGMAAVNENCMECLEWFDFCPSNALIPTTPNKGSGNEKRNM